MWEDYGDAFLSILKDYFRCYTSNRKEDSNYLENLKVLIPKLLELNPNIDTMLFSSSDKVIYKIEKRESTEGIKSLI
ncbi:MAG: hypothetical protein ACFFG0_45780 [Candidatus Thorarchaeota archaeon]